MIQAGVLGLVGLRLRALAAKLRFSICLAMVVSWSSAVSGAEPVRLPGTALLAAEGDWPLDNLERVDRLMLREIAAAPALRAKHWPTLIDGRPTDPREELRRIIGAVDKRAPARDLELVATLSQPALVAESATLRCYAVRWAVLEGVDAEGLLLEPRGRPIVAHVVAIPDADQSPEMLAGLSPGLPPQAQFARRLADAGCRVLVPTLIDRRAEWSGKTNQTHREFIYRQAYFMGRHIIGYEVQKVLAAIDYFEKQPLDDKFKARLPVGVAGWGEGALVAFYSAACDRRIESTLVSGYFAPREPLWTEPVYRNVWGLLRLYGDAELAFLVAPRALTIEACRGPEVPGPPPPVSGRNFAATGALITPPLEAVKGEFERAKGMFAKLKKEATLSLISSEEGQGPPGSPGAMEAFYTGLGIKVPVEKPAAEEFVDTRAKFAPTPRMKRQFDQLVAYTQRIAAQSPKRRAEYWAKADSSSLEKWQTTTSPHCETLWSSVIGKMPAASLPPNPRTRLVYDTPKWEGYEVLLDVWPEVTAYGILLVPKDLPSDERRPVVVAQHGRAGRPQDVCNPDMDTRAYHSFGAKLADEGFIVFAPQNLFIGEETYRQLQRKANSLGLTFFAPMVRQHEQILKWLGTLPFVASERIGFYGLSYGGKSAMLIPAVLEGYALSICSGDFNEQVWKHVSVQDRYSFMFTNEHDHSEFDFGERFNYAEIAGLIAPRPFMVERGHRDGVAPDEWVAYEYAKVRRRYVELGIGDRTTIEFFNGVHEIHGQGTFEFLRRHLKWSRK